jgi:GR25 family glycosyltransferase involved in LPS biosynthesis
MNNYGIIICLENSINSNTIKNRTKNLIDNLNIQFEIKHPISSTIGCFNSHMKALKYAIKILLKNINIDYVIIGEEDITIDYNSQYYKNLLLCLKEYNKQSNYILHLGGFPGFTTNLFDIIKNNYDNIKLKSKIYLTTAYVVNLKTAIKLFQILNNSSNHIHCDAIFANSGIDQYLVKGNIVNQLEIFKSDNTYINNYISTKKQSSVLIKLNQMSILLINNYFTFLLFLIIVYYQKKNSIILVEFLITMSKSLSKNLVKKKYNKYLPKNIFIFFELLLLLRIYTILKLLI